MGGELVSGREMVGEMIRGRLESHTEMSLYVEKRGLELRKRVCI